MSTQPSHASAIAANFVTLSLDDALIIQNAVTKIPEGTNIQTVHDCFYSTPSEISSVVRSSDKPSTGW